jgi:ribosomal protein L11 methyltransferase
MGRRDIAMSDWPYLEGCVLTSDFEIVSAILWDMRTDGIEEVDTSQEWTRFRAYFPARFRIISIQKKFIRECRRQAIQPHQLLPHSLENRDWLQEWRAGLKPFSVGRKFFVIPTERQDIHPPRRRIPLLLEPGMAFGTGTHETTQLCLEAIELYACRGGSFLDIGTGSGILAMAAFKLGVKKIVGCDIDPDAIHVARSNAVINLCNKIEWILGDIETVSPRRFDLAAANLTIEPIEKSLPQMEKRVKRGGWLILSGLLKNQVKHLGPMIEKSSLQRIRLRSRGEWVCLVLRRRLTG